MPPWVCAKSPKVFVDFCKNMWYNEGNEERGERMKITVLAENTAACADVVAEHGLALLVETGERTILCDGGQSAALLSNAAALGVDLSAVEAAVLSHGHYDHSGGVSALAKTYPQIPVYLRQGADGDFFHGERYIGIDKALAKSPQSRFVSGAGVTDLGGGVSVFGGFDSVFDRPFANAHLTVRENDIERPDDFAHEQATVVCENGKRVLVSGCAHSGILNILGTFTTLYGGMPDAVFSGFHTVKNEPYTAAETAQLQMLASALTATGATFFTGHCTGDEAFDVMKPLLGDRLVRMRCGDTFEI